MAAYRPLALTMSDTPTTAVPVTAPAAGAPRSGMRAFAGGPGGRQTAPYAFPYDAANWSTAEMGEWLPWLRSPDTEITPYRDRMVARQRDLYRNDGWARGAIGRILDSTIGTDYRLVSEPDWRGLSQYAKGFDAAWAKEFRDAVEARWRLYSTDLGRYSDVSRQLTVSQQFRLALGHKLIDGESLILNYWLPERVGRGAARYATAFMVVDPDRLSNPYQQPDSRFMRGGVEIDALGVPLAYHVRKAEPNDWYNAVESMQWERILREDADGAQRAIHDFDRDRAGQNRGISVFAPILSRMKMLARYYGVELQAATVASVFGTYVTSPYDPEMVEGALTGGGDESSFLNSYQGIRSEFHKESNLQLNGAKLAMLAPGEKIETVASTRPNSAFTPFAHEMLRGMAACLGVTAEQVTQDYSETNYSSTRAAIVEAEKSFNRRCGDFNANTATPVFAGWLHEAMDDEGELPLPRNAPAFIEARTAYARCSWLGPAAGWTDPVAQRQGVVLGLDAGLSTLRMECAKQGLDVDEVLEERAAEITRMRELGIPLPTWLSSLGMQGESASDTIKKPEAA